MMLFVNIDVYFILTETYETRFSKIWVKPLKIDDNVVVTDSDIQYTDFFSDVGAHLYMIFNWC